MTLLVYFLLPSNPRLAQGRLSLYWLLSGHQLQRDLPSPFPPSPGHLAPEARASIVPPLVAATVATTDAIAPALPWLSCGHLPSECSQSLPEAASTGSGSFQAASLSERASRLYLGPGQATKVSFQGISQPCLLGFCLCHRASWSCWPLGSEAGRRILDVLVIACSALGEVWYKIVLRRPWQLLANLGKKMDCLGDGRRMVSFWAAAGKLCCSLQIREVSLSSVVLLSLKVTLG